MKNKVTVVKSEKYNEVIQFSLTLWFGLKSYRRQTISRYVHFVHPIQFDYAFYILPKMKKIHYAYEQEFYLEKITIGGGG